jgi:hypothetical protein
MAVVTGESFADAFESMGANGLVPGSHSGIPSIEEILDGLRALRGEHLILLPNSREALAAAREAARRAPRPVTVIPTLTLPQGIAALIAFRFDADLGQNAALMERAAQSVRTIEITWEAGIVMGRLDDDPADGWQDHIRAVQDLLGRVETGSAETVTVYSGGSVDVSRVEEVCQALSGAMPHADVQVVRAGPERPCLIISVE